MSYEWIQHKGKRILYVDYSKYKTKEEMIVQLNEMAEVFKKSTGNILSIDNFEGTFASHAFLDRAKELGHIFSKYRKKGAVLGITGTKKFLLQVYNKFTKDKMVPFDTKEEALEYLVND